MVTCAGGISHPFAKLPRSVTILVPESAVKREQKITVLIGILFAFTGGALAGNELSSKQARHLIARMNGSNLPPENIHIRSIDVGPGGRDAVVEALVQTGFKLTREGGQWSVTHVRTGDRQWESLELVVAAVRTEKVRRTAVDLAEMGRAAAAYHRTHDSYPQVRDFAALVDSLLPGYLHRIIREDYWNRSYIYEPQPGGFRLLSVGPDGRRGSDDDIVIEIGQQTPQSAG
jgi:hypothetical protein